MKVIFRAEAADDLRSIIAYYEDVAPEALANILIDIHRSIDQLPIFRGSECRWPIILSGAS